MSEFAPGDVVVHRGVVFTVTEVRGERLVLARTGEPARIARAALCTLARRPERGSLLGGAA